MKYIPALLLLGAMVACRTNQSPEAQVDDIEITAQLKAKLASEIGVTSVTNISVNSTNGVVTLAGQVNTPATKARAVDVARGVPKVVRVIDNLQVVAKPATTSVLQFTPMCGPRIAHTSA